MDCNIHRPTGDHESAFQEYVSRCLWSHDATRKVLLVIIYVVIWLPFTCWPKNKRFSPVAINKWKGEGSQSKEDRDWPTNFSPRYVSKPCARNCMQSLSFFFSAAVSFTFVDLTAEVKIDEQFLDNDNFDF